MEQAWRSAELAGDVEAMGRLLSDDFVGINMSGQVVTKTQLLERMRNRRTVMTRLDLDDVHVKLIGPTAIVTSRAEVRGQTKAWRCMGPIATHVSIRGWHRGRGRSRTTRRRALGLLLLPRRQRGVPARMHRLRSRSEAAGAEQARITTSAAKAKRYCAASTARINPCP